MQLLSGIHHDGIICSMQLLKQSTSNKLNDYCHNTFNDSSLGGIILQFALLVPVWLHQNQKSAKIYTVMLSEIIMISGNYYERNFLAAYCGK